jgi:integrase
MPTLPKIDSQIRRLQPIGDVAQTEYRDESSPGLSLIVGKKRKTWSLTYTTTEGRRRRVSLGLYPDVSLANARRKAEDIRAAVRQNADPQAAKRAYKASRTVAEVADDYLRLYAVVQKTTAEFDRYVIEKDLKPAIGAMKVVDVTRRHIQEVLRRPLERGSGTMANRTLEIVRKLFSWAVEQGHIDTNPAEGISKPTKERPRSRSLSDDELKIVWQALDGLSVQSRAAIKLLILTGQRLMDVVGAKWSEIDFERALWTLPAHDPGRSKKRDAPHLVPLSTPALTILADLKVQSAGPNVFTGKRRLDAGGEATRGIVAQAKVRLDEILTDMEPWRVHDLRRTVRTGLSALGLAPHVSELVIGHSVGGFVKVYDRYQYLTEKRDALNRWADHVAMVVGEDAPGGDVVMLPAKAS